MIRYRGINHLAMATRDMDVTIRFWRDLLEMRMVATLGRPGYRHYFFEITEHDMIAFFEWPEAEKISEKEDDAVKEMSLLQRIIAVFTNPTVFNPDSGPTKWTGHVAEHSQNLDKDRKSVV